MRIKWLAAFAVVLFSLAVNAAPLPDSTSNPLIDYVVSLNDRIEREGRFTDHFQPGNASTLPVGIVREIGGTRYIIAIDSAFFTPTGACFNAYMALQFPNSDKRIAFAAKGVRFNPRGVVAGAGARLLLVSEHTLDIGPQLKLKLLPDGQNFIDWDCSGFQGASIKGYFEFGRGQLLPDTTQAQQQNVTASFQLYTNDIHDFIAQVNVTPFCIRGLRDWSFTVTNATVDMSELANAPGMVFPAGYANSQPLWTGFYLRELTVKLPRELAHNGSRTSLQAASMLIDNSGVTGLFMANNVFSMGEGSMSGWEFSLESIGVHLLSNHLNGGHLGGRLHVPVMDSAQSLVYAADLVYNPQQQESDYTISITPQNDVHFDVFAAKVDLLPTSQISVTKSGGAFHPRAVLNGNITVDAGKFKTARLGFEQLTFITARPYVTNGVFSFSNNTAADTTKAANFPLSIASLGLALDPQGHPRLVADVLLKFTDDNNGFSAATRVEVLGRLQEQTQVVNGEVPQTVTQTKWRYDHLHILDIALNVQTQPFSMRGLVSFRENDPVYGDGFFGRLRFILPHVMHDTAQLSACFGRTTFRYWYVDAYVPVNVQLGAAPVTLTRFMGGLYYHMQPQRNTSATAISAVNGSTPPLNGPSQTYVPDAATGLGFKAGTAFKYTPSEKAMNGDVLLEAAFNPNGGLNFVRLDGNVFMLCDRAVRLSPNAVVPVQGSAYILYDAVDTIFDANFNVSIHVQNAITGNGNARVYISPQEWFACAGRPSAPNYITIVNVASAQAYVMAGNTLEPMAAPPAEVATVVSQNGLANQRNNAQLSAGSGFCAGVRISSGFYKEFGWDFFTVYGGFGFGTGFDMMLMNYGPNGHCASTGERVGLNGWQAQGQLYIWLQGTIGAYGHFAGSDFNVQILQANVAAIVGGKAPRPTYLYGAIGCQYNILCGAVHGQFNFDYQFGNDCSVVN